MSILSGILSSVASSVLGNIFNRRPVPSPPVAGAGAAAGGSGASPGSPAPAVENPVGGASMRDALWQGFGRGVQGAIGNHFANQQSMQQANIAGKAQRAFLDNAFPLLNQWEQAGANATQGAMQTSAQQIQERMQKRELKTREDIVDKQVEAEIIKSQIGAAATTGAAGITAAPQHAMVPMLNLMRQSQAWLNENRISTESDKANQGWLNNFATAMMRGHWYRGDEEFTKRAALAFSGAGAFKLLGALIGLRSGITVRPRGRTGP